MKNSKVAGYDKYVIYEDGSVYNTKRNKQIKPQLMKNGYVQIKLSKNNRRKLYYLHRLLAESFIDNTENKPQVNHKNGIKNDNRLCNLEWATQSENMQHAHKMGLVTVHIGSSHHMWGKKANNQYTKSNYIKNEK